MNMRVICLGRKVKVILTILVLAVTAASGATSGVSKNNP